MIWVGILGLMIDLFLLYLLCWFLYLCVLLDFCRFGVLLIVMFVYDDCLFDDIQL